MLPVLITDGTTKLCVDVCAGQVQNQAFLKQLEEKTNVAVEVFPNLPPTFYGAVERARAAREHGLVYTVLIADKMFTFFIEFRIPVPVEELVRRFNADNGRLEDPIIATFFVHFCAMLTAHVIKAYEIAAIPCPKNDAELIRCVSEDYATQCAFSAMLDYDIDLTLLYVIKDMRNGTHPSLHPEPLIVRDPTLMCSNITCVKMKPKSPGTCKGPRYCSTECRERDTRNRSTKSA